MGRSYSQYCGLARALDVVGDRWNLLIVRELLMGPTRFRELLDGLPGVATNLLADRLRGLETAGVIERRLAKEGNAIAYALTPWGAELREPIESLIRWSAPLMESGRGGDALRPRWLAVALPALLRGRTADPPAEFGIEVGGIHMALRIGPDGPHVTVQPDRHPDTVLIAEPEEVLGLAAGVITVDQALSRATVHGDPRVLTMVLGGAQP
ncbi:winged helix-turn-helix transcriptional regulator [Mycobacterium lacus]|uniref:Transcriptional regulator n=1 Tax=Mycobacterium lacus TaxID=169765 RepID=A0A1X1XTV9_9MYCO|nr:helix-turn-helix domain-containing protein [Mycobacterium lacus]MCV7125175.1 helix-turn-helix transcriptional regulator [Mycobacterium lacus]ORW02277.1 HxlR family transcriptional regulator [Mycobacterium lacus]BBX98912.1 transcriptional regulator [Mycobacterium lacus]